MLKGVLALPSAISILGIPFSPYAEQEVLQRCQTYLGDDQPHFIVTAGPELVMKAIVDAKLREVMVQADLVTPDGIGIVIASRWYGRPLTERVTGIDLAERLLAYAADNSLRVYILGASEDSLQRALTSLQSRYPGLSVTGRNGYFSPEKTADVVTAIQKEAPQLLLVGLGQPAQEKFIAKNLSSLNVPLAIGVGGAIDVLAGTVKRAPLFFRKAKLEWLYRLLKEPARIRRQLALPRFALAAWQDARKTRTSPARK